MSTMGRPLEITRNKSDSDSINLKKITCPDNNKSVSWVHQVRQKKILMHRIGLGLSSDNTCEKALLTFVHMLTNDYH